MFYLDNRIAVITGAGSGIGKAIAELFAQHGATVIVADLNEHSGNQLADQINHQGGTARFCQLDVTDEQQCNQTIKQTLEGFGKIDVLVNNAGIGHVGSILETSHEELQKLLQVNMMGTFNMARATLPSMMEKRSGSIINMASIGGVVGVRDRFAYCASKFGVVGMTKAMALDHARDGIRTNCICPGRVETPFVQARIQEYPDPEKAYAEMAASQPVGRMARPDEIAAAALYLASPQAAMVNGSCQMIDGGWSAG